MRIAVGLFITLFLLALMALTQDVLAAVQPTAANYRVTGIESSDVLNIRAQPTVKSAVIGMIPANGTDIRATGRTAQTDRSTWIEIDYHNLRGWVNARYLVAEAPAANFGELQMPLKCGGTEPFWDIRLKGRDMEFSTPETKMSLIASEPQRSANHTTIWSIVLLDQQSSRRGVLFLHRTDNCNDGMSDYLYHYDIMVNLFDTGGVFSGCCSRK